MKLKRGSSHTTSAIGIGAYNAESLRPCLGDTGKLIVDHGTPAAKQLSQKVSQTAQPYVQAAQDKINEMRGRK